MSGISYCQCRLPECPEHVGACDGLDAHEIFGPEMTFCCSRCAAFRRRVASGQLPLLGDTSAVARLKGIMRTPGDKRYSVARQFMFEGHLYAMSAQEARTKAERWGAEDFDSCVGGGHIDIIEEEAKS